MNWHHALKIFVFVLVAAALVAIVLSSRATDGQIIPPGEETYTHLNEVKDIQEGNVTSYLFYDLILSLLLGCMSLSTAMIVIPGTLLLITIFLFSEILRMEGAKPRHMTYALTLIVLSPSILMMYLGFSAYALTVMLVMLIAYLYTRQSFWYAAVIPFLFFADRITGLLVIVLLVILESRKKRTREAIGMIMIALGLFILSGFLPALTLHSLAPFFSIQGNEIFSFFGGAYGYPFIVLFLGILGMILPKSSFSNPRYQSLTMLLLILSLFYDPMRILSMFILVYYGAIAFDNFMKQEWTVASLKHLTLLLIICILFFSTSTTLKDAISDSPQPHEVEGTELVSRIVEKNPSLERTTVLTNPSYNDHVAYYTGLDAIRDPTTAYAVLASQKYSYVKEVLQDNKVSFIILDTSKKEGRLWQRSEQGILFVLQNNRLFKKIYTQGEYAIYYYTEWNEEQATPQITP